MTEGVVKEVPEGEVLTAAVKYCLLLITVPVLSFFVVKNTLFDRILGLEPTPSHVYSAIVAIIILHVALGLYIYKAYGEADKVIKPVKRD